MSDLTGTGQKLDCKIQFLLDGDDRPSDPSPEFDGQIHLFEHTIEGFPTFWHGLVDVALIDSATIEMYIGSPVMPGLNRKTLVAVSLKGHGHAYARTRMADALLGRPAYLQIVGISAFRSAESQPRQ